MEKDLINEVHEFFEDNCLYRAFNTTIVTLIHKHAEAKHIKDFRPIVECTLLYKIISKILTTRL